MGLEQSTIRTQNLCNYNSTSIRPCFPPNCSDLPGGRVDTLVLDHNSSSSLRSGTFHAQENHIPRTKNSTKNIFVVTKEGGSIRIRFDVSEQDNLTCGWLVSETIRQFTDLGLPDANCKDPIVALQTLDGIITLDYWLSELERSVSVLRDGTVLKPFYGNPAFTVSDQKINLEYFQILKLLGTGGSSKVYLARRKDNGRFYAIKAITKKEVVMKDKEETLFNERNIMVRLNHPFLTKLHFAFQTGNQLFLVMDFFPGGELFYHLSQRQKPLTEEQAKVYMGEIILALNYLHKNNIIYRDLKPENILLDLDGHLHLTDFGLCKVLEDKHELTYTFCGSPEYMAPEVINGTGYNYTVDFYSLGMLIYEMVVGRSPFAWTTEKQLFRQITSGVIHFPNTMSSKLRMFLSQMLTKDPRERLGAKYGLAEIVNHPWCAGLDFVSIAKKKGKVSIVPNMYETNFATEFVGAKISIGKELMANRTLEAVKSQEIDLKTESERDRDQAMFTRFANFSFYANVEDPYDKYEDSIFFSNEEEEETPRYPKRVKPLVYNKNNDITDTFLRDERGGDLETHEDSKNFNEKSSFFFGGGETCLRNNSGNYATMNLGLNPSVLEKTDRTFKLATPSFQHFKGYAEYADFNRRKSTMNPTGHNHKPSTYVSDTNTMRPKATKVPSKHLQNETLATYAQQSIHSKPVQKCYDGIADEANVNESNPVVSRHQHRLLSSTLPHHEHPVERKNSATYQPKELQKFNPRGSEVQTAQVNLGNYKRVNLSISHQNEVGKSGPRMMDKMNPFADGRKGKL